MDWSGSAGPRLRAFAGVLLLLSLHPALALRPAGAATTIAPAAAGNDKLSSALDLLERAPSGAQLLKLASKTWGLKSAQDLLSRQIVRPGPASHTDAVLTRRFNPLTGKESRDREVTVYLHTEQSLDELVLDLAHELVHATTRPSWDPYDPELTPAGYVQTAIEGPGGEVDAVVVECQVAHELIDVTGATDPAKARCKDYWGKLAPLTIDRTAILKDFYRVGRWRATLEKEFGPELNRFPLLDTTAPRLYSSTGNAPYPVALLREFQEITEIACQNSRRRLEARAADSQSAAPRREPAAESFIASRCR